MRPQREGASASPISTGPKSSPQKGSGRDSLFCGNGPGHPLLPQAAIHLEPRRLRRATGTPPRAAFRIPPDRNKTAPRWGAVLFGAAGGIRTLGPLLTVTRFPIVLVMTTSIPLQVIACLPYSVRKQKLLYQIFGIRQPLREKFLPSFFSPGRMGTNLRRIEWGRM